MEGQESIWAWACIAIGVYLVVYAVSAMRKGKTQGYYQDHQHDRDDSTSRYSLWVWFRLILGVVSLGAGLAYWLAYLTL